MKTFAVFITNKETFNVSVRTVNADNFEQAEQIIEKEYKNTNDYARVVPPHLTREIANTLNKTSDWMY